MATPLEIVTAFIDAWGTTREELRASIREYFTPTTIWENVGLTITTGVDEALATLDALEAAYGVAAVAVETLNAAAAGDVVLNERIDRLIAADGRELAALRIMGVFEVADGKIAGWRDYFDSAAVPAPAKS